MRSKRSKQKTKREFIKIAGQTYQDEHMNQEKSRNAVHRLMQELTQQAKEATKPLIKKHKQMHEQLTSKKAERSIYVFALSLIYGYEKQKKSNQLIIGLISLSIKIMDQQYIQNRYIDKKNTSLTNNNRKKIIKMWNQQEKLINRIIQELPIKRKKKKKIKQIFDRMNKREVQIGQIFDGLLLRAKYQEHNIREIEKMSRAEVTNMGLSYAAFVKTIAYLKKINPNCQKIGERQIKRKTQAIRHYYINSCYYRGINQIVAIVSNLEKRRKRDIEKNIENIAERFGRQAQAFNDAQIFQRPVKCKQRHKDSKDHFKDQENTIITDRLWRLNQIIKEGKSSKSRKQIEKTAQLFGIDKKKLKFPMTHKQNPKELRENQIMELKKLFIESGIGLLLQYRAVKEWKNNRENGIYSHQDTTSQYQERGERLLRYITAPIKTSNQKIKKRTQKALGCKIRERFFFRGESITKTEKSKQFSEDWKKIHFHPSNPFANRKKTGQSPTCNFYTDK